MLLVDDEDNEVVMPRSTNPGDFFKKGDNVRAVVVPWKCATTPLVHLEPHCS